MFTNIRSNVIYRNPKPHVRSRSAYFPSVVNLGGNELLCLYTVAEAFEAVNMRLYLSRSLDGGETWAEEGRILPEEEGLYSEAGRLSLAPNGDLVALVVRHDRSLAPEEGFLNPETDGFVPMAFHLSRSADGGRTWSPPERVREPIEGPSFELCVPVLHLSDGRLLLPTSTWRGWDGRLPNGNRMGAFVSTDNGRTWPDFIDIMRDPTDARIYWESRVLEHAPGRLAATAWCHDSTTGEDHENHYALSGDGGRTWSPPMPMEGIRGQTMDTHVLGPDHFLCISRRMDRPGLWAFEARIDGTRWVSGEQHPLWGADAGGLTGRTENMAGNFAALRFGAPCTTDLGDNRVHVAFWCHEDHMSILRAFILDLDPALHDAATTSRKSVN